MRYGPRRALVVAVVALAGCGSGSNRARTLPEGGSGFRVAGTEDLREAPAPAPVPQRERPPKGKPAGLPMPLERAATQLLLVGFEGTEPRAAFFERLRGTGFGAIAFAPENDVDDPQLAALAGEVGVVADGGGHPPPLVVATPELRPTASSRRLRALGATALLGPPLDLGTAGGPWEGRAIGDDPAAVSAGAVRSVRRALAGGVAPIVGHFPGEGAASQDPAEGTATVGLSLDDLRAADVTPFAAVAKIAPAVQLSGAVYAAWDGVTPATQSPEVVALLRDELHFRGAIVSADLGAVTLTTGTSVAEAAVDALRAGCDLLWIPGDRADQDAAARAVVRAVRSGRVPLRRVADALRQVNALQRRFAARP